LKAEGNGGAIVWQLNEPWPAISWALVDYYRLSKPAYAAVRRAFQPVLVSLDYPLRVYRAGDVLVFNAWAINDLPESLPGSRLDVTLHDQAGSVVEKLEQPVDVPAASAQLVARAAWRLPPGGGWRLSARLHHKGGAVSENEYDLEAHDDLRPTFRRRLWARLTSLVVPS
jgi:beta-mannosidase